MKQRVIVACSVVSGDPPFTFRWLKDGHEIQNNEHLITKVVDEFTSTLTIYKLAAESVGNYTCRASNREGSDEKHDVLIIEGEKRFKRKFYAKIHSQLRCNYPFT